MSGSETRDVRFGRGDPDSPAAECQHQTTAKDFIAGTGSSGRISILHCRYILVLVVAAWEGGSRPRIARECNKDKNDVKSAVFGDLNKYRRAILHSRSRLTSKPEVLPYFAKDDEISPTSDQVLLIFQDLIGELNCLGRKYYATDPELVFGRKLHEPTQTSK